MSGEIEPRNIHDKNCSCGCQNEHDHEHAVENKFISITTHDKSIVLSYKFSIAKPYDDAELILDNSLKCFAKEIAEFGGLIGHIKAVLTSEEKSCIFSITEEETEKRTIRNNHCNIEGVAIVFFIEPHQLEDIFKNVFAECLSE